VSALRQDISDEISEIARSLAQTPIEKEIRAELQPGVRGPGVGCRLVLRREDVLVLHGGEHAARKSARDGQDGSAPCIWQTGNGPGGPESQGAGSRT
jgi:hypothetical protein